jgi:ABC-2 type transport system ATP-binding protein
MGKIAISVQEVTKRYGNTKAIDNLSLEIPEGMIYGLLGPNGAGKTTLIRILSTLLSYDSGKIHISGYDLFKEPHHIREIIGLAGQYAAIDENLTGYENLYMIARLFHHDRKESKKKAGEAIRQVSLEDAAYKITRTYSGGMRRRLDLAASFLNTPKILFLDEPTEGLDSHSRKELWTIIRNLAKGGTTIILTTHFLEEADNLCERIAIINHGKVLVEGKNEDIKKKFGHDILSITTKDKNSCQKLSKMLTNLSDHPPRISGNVLSLDVKEGTKALMKAVRIIEEEGFEIDDITIKQPSLDDVFTKITEP